MPTTTSAADRAKRITHRPGRMGLVTDVAAQLGRGAQSVHEILWRLEAQGVAHVAGWAPSASGRGMRQPLFKAWPGVSAPYPNPLPGRESLGRRAGGTRSEVLSFAAALKAMLDGATRAEVLEQTGISWSNFSKMLRELRAQRLVHVSSWEPRVDGRASPVEVFKFAPGRDAQKPKRVPVAEKYKRYRDGRNLRVAGQRIVHAISGATPIVSAGVQAYGRLGGGAV
jgi:hypothetical protein